MRLAFEQKALQCYEEVCVNKGLVRQASIGSHSLPTYVSEWIVSRHLSDGQIDDAARRRMRQFMVLDDPLAIYYVLLGTLQRAPDILQISFDCAEK
jgi:hypothetical protein